MFKKTIKIFPAPHVEVRLHVSKEMVKLRQEWEDMREAVKRRKRNG